MRCSAGSAWRSSIRQSDAADEAGRSRGASWKKFDCCAGVLRAGQLATAGGSYDNALKLLGKAHALAPQERSVAMLYAELKLRAGDAAEAAALLEPFCCDGE